MKRLTKPKDSRRAWMAVILTCALLVPFLGRPAVASLDDCIDATCRITGPEKTLPDGQVGSDRGTGCAFYHAPGAIWVLTNAHVVADNGPYRLEFWAEGHISSPLPGRVLSRDQTIDAAILEVAESAFGGRLPPIIPLAMADASPQAGQTIASAGCAWGGWSTAWKGHVIGYRGQDMYFVPPPADGRSGSAIFDAEGTKIVGLLHSRNDATGEGVATGLPALRGQMYATCDHTGASRPLVPVVAPAGARNTQCGPGGCPARPPQQPYRMLPYRQQQEAQKGAWPTLPAPAPQAAPQPAPAADLSPIQQQLARIADKLDDLRQPRAPGGPAVPAPSDPAVAQAVSIAQQAVEATEATKKKVAELENLAATVKAGEEKLTGDVKAVVENHAKLAELVAKHGTLAERFEARKAEVDAKLGEHAGKLEKVHEFARSLIEDKIGALKDGHGDTRLIILIVVLAGIGIFAVIVIKDLQHKKNDGDPLIIEKLAARLGTAAVGHPMLAPAANLLGHAAHDVTALAGQIDQRILAHRQAEALAKATVATTPVPAGAVPPVSAAVSPAS